MSRINTGTVMVDALAGDSPLRMEFTMACSLFWVEYGSVSAMSYGQMIGQHCTGGSVTETYHQDKTTPRPHVAFKSVCSFITLDDLRGRISKTAASGVRRG